MADPADLTTLDNAKAWLNLTSAVSDEMLQRLITACSTFMQSWMNKTVRLVDYVETRNGIGGTRLLLRNSPVASVASLSIDGQAIAARAAPGGYGYTFDDISVMVYGTCFTIGQQNVTIAYRAGYASVPADLEQACLDTIGDWFKYRDRIGKTSEAIEGQSISFTNASLPARAKDVMMQYRSVVLP